MANRALKVGDRVRFKRAGAHDGYSFEPGDVVTVSRVFYSHPNQNFWAEESEEIQWPNQSVEHVDKKFEVGDVVRCTVNSYGAVDLYAETVVTEIDPCFPNRMNIKGGNTRNIGKEMHYKMDNFELVRRKTKKKHNVSLEQEPITAVVEEAVETKTMAVNFRTTHYINESAIESFSVHDQGVLIERLEKELARLEGFTTKTKAIEREIAQGKKDLKKVAKLFDSLETV